MKLSGFLGDINDGWCHSVPSLQHNQRQKRKARGNMGCKNEAGKKPQRIFNLTRLSETSGSHKHCDITVVKNPFPESHYYMHARSFHSLLPWSYPHRAAWPQLVWSAGPLAWRLLGQADLREKSKPKDGINTEKLSWVEIEPPEAQLRLT